MTDAHGQHGSRKTRRDEHELLPAQGPPPGELPSISLPEAHKLAPWTPGYRAFPRPLHCHFHADYTMGMHRQEFTEVALVVSGRGRVRMADHLWTTGRGDLHVIPAGVAHGYTAIRNLNVYHVELPASFLQRHGPALHMLPGFSMLFTVEPYFRVQSGFRHGLKLAPQDHRHVVQLFRLLERESALPQKSSAFSLDTLGLHVLATLCRLYAEQFPHDDDLTALPRPTQAFAGVFRLVAERYQQKLSLTELAEAAHMHPSHFCRLFHRVMGITPMGYVIHHRVQVGRLLLSQTSRSVTDISHATGFYDTSHFCRTFARVMGMSPSEYRQSQPVADALASVWDVAPLSDPAPEQD